MIYRKFNYVVTFVASLLLILASSRLQLCTGEDRLTPDMPIGGNQTIISNDGRFELGFFIPGNSSTNQYLGIWYHKIPERTVVWLANRDAPLRKNSIGIFALSDEGNLVILDETRPIWTSNVSSFGASGNISTAILENSGNLILRDSKGSVLWQSFDYPTDTLLPGMKFGLNMKTGKNSYLTSWKGEDDPMTGVFRYGFYPRGPLQFFIWENSHPYWRSHVWEGTLFTTSVEASKNHVTYATYTVNDDFFYVTLSVSDNSILSRLVLDRTGRIELQSWQESSMKWLASAIAPQDECDIYGRCGSFGSCEMNDKPHICNCLTGFKPKVQIDWDMGNWSGGCVRQKELTCDREDVFVIFSGMKLPDNSFSLKNLTIEQCKIECRRNCSCTAYAYANASVGVMSRCIYWAGNLMDVKHDRGELEDSATPNLYIRVHGSEQVGNGQHVKKKHGIVIAAAAMGVLLIGSLSCALLRRKLTRQRRRETSVMGINFKASNTPENQNGPELTSFSISSILAATDNFSATNKLGEGGFGPVYKGSLPDGQEIAVKRLSKLSGQGLEEFMNEVTLIAKLQHKNLVRLLGCCTENEEKMLIYEFLTNKSLDKFLFDTSKQVSLDWRVRFHITEGIAQGLLYLHKYSRLRIIHRDLKASNILLDGAMNPKISDFGMARIFGGNQTEANTGRVVGTYGYMSPEYALNGNFSEKSDVFSFGVLLIEIVSGKRNTGVYPTNHSLNLLGYAWELFGEGRALELMDQSIEESCIPQEIVKCIQIGLLCVQEDADARPTMSSVVFMLGSSATTLPSPKEPAFFIGRSRINFNAGYSSQNCSINEVTMSSIEPR